MQSIRCQGLRPGLDAPQTGTRGPTLGGFTETTSVPSIFETNGSRCPLSRRLPRPDTSGRYRRTGSPRISADPPEPAAAPVPGNPSLPPEPRDPAAVAAPSEVDAFGADAAGAPGRRGTFLVAFRWTAARPSGDVECVWAGWANDKPLPSPNRNSSPAAAFICTFLPRSMLSLRRLPCWKAADMPPASARSHDSCCPACSSARFCAASPPRSPKTRSVLCTTTSSRPDAVCSRPWG